MGIKTFRDLLPEDQRDAFDTALEAERESARVAGHNAAGYDKRQAERAVTERDRLASELETLKASVPDVSSYESKMKDLERQARDLAAERDKLKPIVERHRTATLRDTVAKTAKLKDPLLADALIGSLGLTLTDDDTLAEEHAQALTAWATDPANAGRVQGEEKPSMYPNASAVNQGRAQNLSDPLRAFMSRLPEKEKQAAEKALA